MCTCTIIIATLTGVACLKQLCSLFTTHHITTGCISSFSIGGNHCNGVQAHLQCIHKSSGARVHNVHQLRGRFVLGGVMGVMLDITFDCVCFYLYQWSVHVLIQRVFQGHTCTLAHTCDQAFTRRSCAHTPLCAHAAVMHTVAHAMVLEVGCTHRWRVGGRQPFVGFVLHA